MRVVNVYTGQLYVTSFDNPLGKVVDITVKTGLRYLAPNWDFLMEYKNSKQTHEDMLTYMDKYYDKLEHTFTYFKQQLDILLQNETIILGCYCHEGKFCHRHLLLYPLRDYALSKNIRLNYLGEISRKGIVLPSSQDIPMFHSEFLGEVLGKRK